MGSLLLVRDTLILLFFFAFSGIFRNYFVIHPILLLMQKVMAPFLLIQKPFYKSPFIRLRFVFWAPLLFSVRTEIKQKDTITFLTGKLPCENSFFEVQRWFILVGGFKIYKSTFQNYWIP